MRTLWWISGIFLVLCLATGIALYVSAPQGAKPLSNDAIIAIQSDGSSDDAPQDLVVLRKNQRYDQWIVDPKSGRVFFHTQKWALGRESQMAGMVSENSVVLSGLLNASKVVKNGSVKNASDGSYESQPPEFYRAPTPSDFEQIIRLRAKWKASQKSHGEPK